MVSVIIPSRQPEFLQQTIDDLLSKAEGEVEVIVVLDGYWPNPMLRDDSKVIILHQGTIHGSLGMRAAINAGVAIARGQYIMKIDEHCLVSQGYDKRLVATCQDDWLVVPRRYRLDAENWKIIEDGRTPIDYMYVSYPYRKLLDSTSGLYGAEDKTRYRERKNVEIDDLMTMQGSCWFIKKDYFHKLFPKGMDSGNYGPFNHEAQELSNTVWLSGGRVVVDKACHYAHYHKGKKGKGYGFSREQYRKFMADKEKARRYAIKYWLDTKDFKYDWEWLMGKFDPVPTWPSNWREQIKEDEKQDWVTLGQPTWGNK